MKSIEDYGKVVSTDVLVIGGGISGLPAALKAKEKGVDVLIVDKGTVGFAGMAPRGGNGILALPKDADLDKYVEFVTKEIGLYLNDQNVLRKFAEHINPSLRDLADWGVQLSTYENGEIAVFPFGNSPIFNTGINLYANDNMRKTAEKKGIHIQNHVNVTSLIRKGDRVVGAVGFDIFDGTFYIFIAKAVLVGCGASQYKATRMFTSNGEGNKLAWEVGAQMRSAEFAYTEIASEVTTETIHGGHHFVFNQNGENLWKKYVTTNTVDVCAEMILGMEKEIREGRGPLYIDFNIMHNDDAWKAETRGLFADAGGPKKLFPDKLSWTHRTTEREGEYFHVGDKSVVTFSVHGNSGFVRVDKDMKTTVKGLYVIGADNANGSGIHGSAPLPAGQRGGSFMHCVVTGVIAGTNAADEVKAIGPHADIPADLISELKEQAYVSLNRKNGIDARTMLTRVQNVACPIDIMLRKSEQSLTRAIGQMNEIKADLTKLVAKDYHELKLCNEVEAMALTTEIMIKSALVRTESRDFHFREDYPKIDNKHWLKWVLANNVNGDVVISTEDVPIKDYPYQPADL